MSLYACLIVCSVMFTALAISKHDFLSVLNWDTMNNATPAIVYGYLPVAICSLVISLATYLAALLTSIGSYNLLQA